VDDLRHGLDAKDSQLKKLRPLPEDVVRSLDAWFRVELTYTSNARYQIIGRGYPHPIICRTIKRRPRAPCRHRTLRPKARLVSTLMKRLGLIVVAVMWFQFTASPPAVAQVNYDAETGSPWNQRADDGPDAQVPGWYYNLGVTGIRAELVAAEPTTLHVRYVFPGSIASGLIEAGDVIGGVGGRPFQVPHRNGYGVEFFGGHGPIMEFAAALEACQEKKADGKPSRMIASIRPWP